MSGGAAWARNLANLIPEEEILDLSWPPGPETAYELRDDGTVKRVERPVYAKFENVSIRFLGLFDTVAAFGWPTNGKDIGYDLSVDPEFVRNVRHAVVADEVRYAFDLHSIVRDPEAPWADANLIEHYFGGGHSDVGGGIKDKSRSRGKSNDLAKVALAWMHREALAKELPLAELPDNLTPGEDVLEASADELLDKFIHDPPSWYILERILRRQARTVYFHTPFGRVKRRRTLEEAIARAEADRPRVLVVEEGADEHRATEPKTTQ